MLKTNLRKMSDIFQAKVRTDTGIAIIGMAGRYPEADSPAQLWDHIRDGKDLAKRERNFPNAVSCDYSLPGVDLFDNQFFGYQPSEAILMDPQHRLFLTSVLRALEDAGNEFSTSGERVAVYGASSISSYLLNVILPNLPRSSGEINYNVLLGNDKDFLANSHCL